MTATACSQHAPAAPQDVKMYDIPATEELREAVGAKANPGSDMEIVDSQEAKKAEKKLVRKIDLFLLPMIWVVYLLSYMVSLGRF